MLFRSGYVYVMTVLIAEILDTLGDIMERAEDAIVLEKIPVKKSMIKERTSQVLYIVCPCYNEAESLGGGTFDRLQDLMGELTAAGLCSPKSRILMVNDGSTDQTAELLEQRHRENPLFSYINLSRNFGHQYALLCGLMNARKYADVTITIDADLQQDINAIRDFLEKYYEGYEIVYGVRKSRKSDGVFKKWSACLFYDIIGKLSGYKIIKNHADYRLMSRKAMDVLAEFGETNLFLRGLIPMIGFPSCIVYFDVQPRKFGESKYNLQKMFRLAIDGVTSLSIRPIRWVFLCGTLMFAVSLLVMGGYLIAFLQGKSISGYTSIIMSLWLIGGMLMMSIGCVGEYIGKLYFETKKRPRYIVEEIQNDTEFEYIGREKVQEEEKRCIICGGRLVTSRLPGLVACEECNFITTDLNLSVEEIRRLYSSGYYNGEEYADYVRDKAIIQKNFRRRLRRIERYLDVPKEKKLFEIGCAYGFFLQVAGERFGKVSGIDIADDAVKYASEELSLEAYAGDYLAFQDKDVYDIICMWDTIEHLSAPDKYIEKAHKCLKQGGLLCITTGDIGSINAKIRGAKWRQIHPPTHLHYFSKETLKNLLEKKGFQVLEVSYPANELSFNTILYTILCLKSNHEKLYGVLARMGITKWNIKMNMRDFMFVIAKKEKSGREHHDSI